VSERKGTSGQADWAVDSARSDELAASGPPEQVRTVLESHMARSGPPPARRPSVPPPPSGAPLARVEREAPTTVGMEEPPATRPSPSVRTHRRLGKYQFIATLGRGGMADVHLAVSMGPAGFSKLQVIKRLRPNIAEELEFRNMLLDEARLAARLNHRNVVQTNEVGLADDEYFIAMEYLDGQPLSRVLTRARERERPIPIGICLWILSEVLAGLHYAHELVDYDGAPLNVVHRDVSPHNIFVTYDGQVKVVDFGIALAARRVVETQAGTMKGKIAYMAPEQAFSPSSEIDRRADVFSVGIILWEIIAGRRLWRGLTDPQIISRLLREMPDIRTARPEAPFELARICNQALARVPESRFSSAAEFRAELERYLERLGEQVTAQQVGELVSELFASERAEIRGIIDRQLKGLRERGAETEAEVSSGRASILPSLPVRETYDAYSSEEGAVSSSSPSASSARRSRTSPSGSSPPQGTLQAVIKPEPEPVAQPEPAPARSRLPLLAGGAALAVLAAVTSYLQLQARSSTGADTPARPAQTAAPAPPGPPQEATPAPAVGSGAAAPQGAFVHARIKGTPEGAKILVDGSELPSNPFDGKFIKDGAAHRIELQAPGYVAQRRMLVFDKDIELELTLYLAQSAQTAQKGPSPAPATPPSAPVQQDVVVPEAKPDPY
jgi:eukaryotic-like serine/threonine-protein kinase